MSLCQNCRRKQQLFSHFSKITENRNAVKKKYVPQFCRNQKSTNRILCRKKLKTICIWQIFNLGKTVGRIFFHRIGSCGFTLALFSKKRGYVSFLTMQNGNPWCFKVTIYVPIRKYRYGFVIICIKGGRGC